MLAPRWFVHAVAVSLALVLVTSCSPGEGDSKRPPILVVGMDGLEWTVLEDLLEEGKLPNFQSLLERGVGGHLRTTVPTYSPVLWTSIATGVRERQHGVLYFLEVRPDGSVDEKEGLPYTSNCRKVPALWNIAGDQNRSSLTVAWWVSWPAEPIADGRIVSSYAGQAQAAFLWKPIVHEDGMPELTWPRALQKELLPYFKNGSPTGPLKQEYNDLFGVVNSKWKLETALDIRCRMTYHGDRTHLEIMKRELDKEIADLNMVYFGLPDVAGHFFWRYYEPEAYQYKIGPQKMRVMKDFIPKAYERADQWLGELVAKMPTNARIMVVSDHGMHAGNLADRTHIQSGTHDDGASGVLIMAGPGIRQQGRVKNGMEGLGNIFDIAPTLLDWLGLAVAEDMEGESLRRWMTTDWVERNPEQSISTYANGFRAATPPRLPDIDADAEFRKSFSEIGYLED